MPYLLTQHVSSRPPTITKMSQPSYTPPVIPPPPPIADETANNLVNMYFLMLIVLVVVLLVGLWYWQQNRRRKRLRSAGRRRSALEQDLELPFGRPAWLGLSRREREEEGVDERGEAPPPYTPPPPLEPLPEPPLEPLPEPPLEPLPTRPEQAHVRDERDERDEGLPKYEDLQRADSPRAGGSGTDRGS